MTEGGPTGALKRRLDEARVQFAQHPECLIVVSGGKLWHGQSEAQAMAAYLVAHGIPKGQVLTECMSQTTWENAKQVARLLRSKGIQDIRLVTCDFHMPRAVRFFRQNELRVTPAPAPSSQSRLKRIYLTCREWGAARLSIWESLRS